MPPIFGRAAITLGIGPHSSWRESYYAPRAVTLHWIGPDSLTEMKSCLRRKVTRVSQLLGWATVWPQQTWAEKWGCAPFRGGAGSPSSIMWSGPRPTSVPNGTKRRSSVVCLSVCLSVTIVSPAKTAELFEMPFGHGLGWT